MTRPAVEVDVGIVGQGIAGTTLAWHLRWRGVRVLLIDRREAVTASRIAAGLVTPITGKRLATTWRLDELWPAAVVFYSRVEAETGRPVFHRRRMVRLFASDEEREVFARKRDAEFRGRVEVPDPLVNPAWFATPRGGFEMAPAGQLDVPAYLDASRAHFADSFLEADLDPGRDVDFVPGGMRLPRLNVTTRTLVFCTGFAARTDPWFGPLPFHAAKGEILTLRIPGLTEDRVVHRGVWLAPAGDGLFRAGSTYEWDELDTVPTARRRQEILARLREFLKPPVEVVGHHAAVRPVIDAGRPVLGFHPAFPQLACFNGLGSKGSLLAPFFAGQLAAALCGDGHIDPAADVAALPEPGPRTASGPGRPAV